MTFYEKEFYWIPAKGEYDQSVRLSVSERDTMLSMSSCVASNYLGCEDDCDILAIRELTIEELRALHEAIGKALEFIDKGG